MTVDAIRAAEIKAGAGLMSARRDDLAAAIVDEHFRRVPALLARSGEAGRDKCVADTRYTLSYLAEAMANDSPILFIEYVGWIKILLGTRNIPAEDLISSLRVTAEIVTTAIGGAAAEAARGIIEAALARFATMPERTDSFLAAGEPLGDLAAAFLAALLRADRAGAAAMIARHLAEGGAVKPVYLGIFQPVMREVGRLWHANLITVAQEHFITAAVQMVMSQLYPHIFATAKNGRTLVATCVSGELHEIGIRVVADLFEFEGWSTHYLGANMPAAAVVKTVVDRDADILAISATIAGHLSKVAELIEAVRQDPGCRRVRILVGGYPFNLDAHLWRRLRADGSAIDSEQAILAADRLIGVGP